MAAVIRRPEVGSAQLKSVFADRLRQIILNVCRGAARALRPTISLEDDVVEPGPRDNARQRVGHRDSARRLLEHVLGLPPEYREPLLLRCERALSYQQIGDILGLPVTTIETRLARARRMLREEIGEETVMEETA